MAVATWDPSHVGTNIALQNSNSTAAATSGTCGSVLANVGVDATNQIGRYFEVIVDVPVGHGAGVALPTASLTNWVGQTTQGWAYWASGNAWNGTSKSSGLGTSATAGDILRFFVKDGKIWFGKNTIWNGNPNLGTGAIYSGITGTLYPAASPFGSNCKLTLHANQSNITYSPPDGCFAWADLIVTIGNNATRATGGPVDRISVFDWMTLNRIAIAIPAGNGDWTASLSDGRIYGVTYLASGCKPITHGPYTS